MKWPWSVTAKGFAMGVADLVPGVSGGTVAFIDYEYGDTNYREYDIANHFGKIHF